MCSFPRFLCEFCFTSFDIVTCYCVSKVINNLTISRFNYKVSNRELCHFTSKPIGDKEDTLKSFMVFDITSSGSVFRVVVKSQIMVPTTRKKSYCGGCKNCRYMLHIAAFFQTAYVHEIYCSVPLDCRSSSSLLWCTTAVVHRTTAIYVF